MAKVVIFGAGTIARLAHFYFTRDSDHEVVAFMVDKEFLKEKELCGLPVLPFDAETLKKFPTRDYKVFVGLSGSQMNKPRAARYAQMKELGYELVSYVSSKCTYLSQFPPGDNCFILEDNTIQPYAKIGNNVTLWSGNHIGHDSIIEDHCFLTSHVVVSGYTHIKSFTFIGVNATIRDSIVIETATLIGAGSIIMKSTVPNGVYLPERAKIFHKPSNEIEF